MHEFEIRLEGVKFFARHGVFDHERRDGNEFEADVVVKYPSMVYGPHFNDDINETISYVSIFNILKNEMMNPRHLLETVASDTAFAIKGAYPQVSYVEVKITKLAPPIPGFQGRASVSYILN